MRSGFVEVNIGRLRAASFLGYYWSRDAATYSSPVGVNTAKAYLLDFNTGTVYPSGGPYNRWYGHPLRCLAL